MLGNDEANDAVSAPSMNWIERVAPLLEECELNDEYHAAKEATDAKEVLDALTLLTMRTMLGNRKDAEDETTEMDMYERYFGRRDRLFTSRPPHERRDHCVNPDSTILSELTKTEKEFQADGSVITKTVLRRRFSDGREENAETIETAPAMSATCDPQHSALWPPRQGVPRPLQSSNEASGNDQLPPKRSGWFWSS